MDFTQTIFKKKTYADILEKIYKNTEKKEKSIDALISSLKDKVIDANSALQMVPLIKEYLNAGLKNDENLIKMVAIVQRSVDSEDGAEGLEMSQVEKDELVALSKSYQPEEITAEIKKSKTSTK